MNQELPYDHIYEVTGTKTVTIRARIRGKNFDAALQNAEEYYMFDELEEYDDAQFEWDANEDAITEIN